MLAFVLALLACALASDAYHESLTLRPLPENMVLATFEFGIKQDDLHDYSVFPRTLGQILDQSSVQELRLRMSQGWWDAETWGAEVSNGTLGGGIGVELWAWVSGDSLEDAQANWHRLVHSLSGYFCASVNFIDQKVTSYPTFLEPRGQITDRGYLMRGALPAEPVCTENLTPFLRLLPCKGSAGIGSLLDGHRLFDSQWQTMGVDIYQADGVRHFDASVASVADTDRLQSRPSKSLPLPVPTESLECDPDRPEASEWVCFPRKKPGASFRLSDLFGEAISRPCPLAGDARIVVDAPPNWRTDPEDLRVTAGLDLLLSTDDAATVSPPALPKVYVDRSVTGWGQQSGGLRTVFTNPGTESIRVTYFETLPWFVRAYLHTLELPDHAELIHYTAAEDRGRPSQLEFSVLVPPGHVALEYQFDRSLLFIEEYPPDANHGFEIAPGLAVSQDGDAIVRTTSLLLPVPVPDFSMPYNVVILTSTVMTLAFGTVFNLISRVVVKESELPKTERPLNRIIQRIRSLLGR